MTKSIRAITASSFLAMFFLGVSASLIGAAARSIGLTPFVIGLLLAVQNIGFMLAVSISGTLADTYQKPRILLAGSICLGLSFLTFYLSDLLWLNLIIMFFIGVGSGTYEGVTDTMLLAIHATRRNLYINVNHFFVTFGSIIIAVYLTFLQFNWRNSMIQAGAVVLLLAVFFSLAKLENKHPLTESYLERLKILTRERTVVVLFILTALVVGVELGSIGILTSFLTELRGFSQVTANIGLIIFLVGLATGRLIVGFFAKENQIVQYILILFGLSFLFFTFLFFINLAGLLIYFNIYLAGISLSALIPLIITLGGLLYKDMVGIVLGAIKVAMPLGGILISFLLSIIAKQVSLQAALIIFPLTCLLAFFILIYSTRHIKSFETVRVAKVVS